MPQFFIKQLISVLLINKLPLKLNEEIYRYNEPLKSDYDSLSRNDLEIRLHIFVSNLLVNDFEKLCNLIYRHDVDESKFNNALRLPDVDEQAWRITHLVLDREMEKVKMRRAYKEHKEKQNRKSIEE